MRIGIVTPAPPDSRHGNRITALRWATILRRLGNHVSISQTYDGRPFDLLVALHALGERVAGHSYQDCGAPTESGQRIAAELAKEDARNLSVS